MVPKTPPGREEDAVEQRYDAPADVAPVRVACLGDVMLDVIVEAPQGLVADDDTPATITFAAGGQAANVAAWVVTLGGHARVFGPHSDHGRAGLVTDALEGRGVEVVGPHVEHPGTVVSLVTSGTRSLASDPGDASWLDHVPPGSWVDGVDWLMVSGYALLRSTRPEAIVAAVAAARRGGARVAVDLASAAMIERYGPARFTRLWQSLHPAVVFANDAEWSATQRGRDAGPPGFGTGGRTVLVLKHGPAGASFVIDGVSDDRTALPGPVVDTTGAGDALTAGYLVGGADVAMSTAAACVAQVGAQPEALA
jgi:sugar/nucleoside kinase (ribokinase family)